MEDVLKKMDSQKRERLINSGFEEFGKNSYNKASTNTIVKNAGISKGLLYHYFKSKTQLYDYLVDLSIKIFADEIQKNFDWEVEDIFLRIKNIVIIKMKIIERFPNVVVFSKRLYENKSLNEVKELIESYLPGIYQRIYSHNINFGLFKDDIDKEKAIKMVQWIVEKYSEEQLEISSKTNQPIDIGKISKELNEYLEITRKAFYKQKSTKG